MNELEPRWSKQDLEKAKGLWLAGHSAGLVAIAVKKTRNAVVGKMRRLGLMRQGTTAVIGTGGRKRIAVVAPPVPPKPLVDPNDVSKNPVTLPELEPHHCRAILGEVGHEGFAMYCADPKADGSSWCLFHHGLYLQPPKERLR